MRYWARLLLQAALAQHAFEKGLAFNEACPGHAAGQSMSNFGLQRCFPAWGEAVIDPYIGGKQRAVGSVAKVFDRAKLNLHLACFRHGRIRAVERTIGPRCTAPADNQNRGNEHRNASHRVHEAGRNTQIAADSPDLDRTATKSRSSSGTNSEVRAPDTVVTRAGRRYSASRCSSTSTAPSPQLT